MKSFLIILSVLFLAACHGNPKKAPAKMGVMLSTPNPNILFEETFEESVFFPTSGTALDVVHGIENCNNNSTTTPATYDWTLSRNYPYSFQGSKSAHFEIRKDQPLVGSGQRIRSEVTIEKPQEDSKFANQPELWYNEAVMFPTIGSEISLIKRDAINQWYEDGSNETTLRQFKNKFYIEVTPASGSSVSWCYDLNSKAISSTYQKTDSFKSIDKDKWHEYTFHFIHSFGSDGLIDVYRDGILLHHIPGRNMHKMLPKWKVGLYSASLTQTENYSRVVYFDNIRIGKKGSTLKDMVSSAVIIDTIPTDTIVPPPPPPLATSPISSFVLINAGKDTVISQITEGIVIKFPAKSINYAIKANSSIDVTSVKFELSGTQSLTYTDKIAPFSMQGDNGSGNYYYGSFRPVIGTYTLKATPYKGNIAGTAATIHFSFIK